MRLLPAALVLSVFSLAACHQPGEPPAVAQSAPEAEASTAPAPAPVARQAPPAPSLEQPLGDDPPPAIDNRLVDTRIVDVQLSDQGDGKRLTGRMTDQFAPGDSVHIGIRTSGTAGTYTLSSKWLQPDGRPLTEYSQVINARGPADTVFSLSKPDGWKPGMYSVQLAINGRMIRTVPFTVR